MPLRALLALFACAEDPADTGLDDGAACTDPEVEMTTPVAGDVFLEGESVALVADGDGVGTLRYTWAVDGDSFTTGSTGTWVAQGVGTHVMTVQLDDDCGVAQDQATFSVAAADAR